MSSIVFETSSLDERSYRLLTLSNGLEVLLVHDAQTDKAGVAMDVNVGYFSDPEHLQGLAHFLEHILFMGTKKYPLENAYSEYIATHGGSKNASTGQTSTKYYFEVAVTVVDNSESPLHGALDRFAQFFIEPLFLPSAVDREVRAVDSEHKKNLQSDLWRRYQLERSFSNPKNPFCHFGTGSLETLEQNGLNVRRELLEFYENKYSANIMKLVVLARETLDEVKSWVMDLFTPIKNKHLLQNRWEDEPLLREEDLLTQCFAESVTESWLLVLQFPFLDEENLFEMWPSRYPGHLIGHEGPGSILSSIKSKGWVNSLNAIARQLCPGSPGIFYCKIEFTKDGLDHYQDVVEVFFWYISLLKEASLQEWVFDELKDMADFNFRYEEKTPVTDFTRKISSVIQKPLPRQWLLGGLGRLRRFDATATTAALECLRPNNFRMIILSQDFPKYPDQADKWYGTKYKLEKIPKDFLDKIGKQAVALRLVGPSSISHRRTRSSQLRRGSSRNQPQR